MQDNVVSIYSATEADATLISSVSPCLPPPSNPMDFGGASELLSHVEALAQLFSRMALSDNVQEGRKVQPERNMPQFFTAGKSNQVSSIVFAASYAAVASTAVRLLQREEQGTMKNLQKEGVSSLSLMPPYQSALPKPLHTLAPVSSAKVLPCEAATEERSAVKSKMMIDGRIAQGHHVVFRNVVRQTLEVLQQFVDAQKKAEEAASGHS